MAKELHINLYGRIQAKLANIWKYDDGKFMTSMSIIRDMNETSFLHKMSVEHYF
jgi:hypothetical protein